MKCFFHDYALTFKESGKKRYGSLVKIEFDQGKVGYADCHPWEEFGDAPLEKQKVSLIKQKPLPLSLRTLYFARLDAEARFEGRSLFNDLSIPKSHFLIIDLINFKSEDFKDFKILKIKLGSCLKKEVEALFKLAEKAPQCKWRLDFNSKLNFSKFLIFLNSIRPLHSFIDFCEDPFPYNASNWKCIEEEQQISLAADFEFSKILQNSYFPKVIVLKPAVQQSISTKSRLIVTSYLDHPLGQICSAYIAAKHMARTEIGGFLSHLVYEDNAFSIELTRKGDLLQPPPGKGFGFDHLLEAVRWNDV